VGSKLERVVFPAFGSRGRGGGGHEAAKSRARSRWVSPVQVVPLPAMSSKNRQFNLQSMSKPVASI
jgi:hypothetical protein